MVCLYQNKECKRSDCKFVKENRINQCAFYGTLETFRQALAKHHEDKTNIDALKKNIIEAYNGRLSSQGIGPAIGAALEKWLREHLGGVEKGKVNFNFGEFEVDGAIPSTKNPRAILEIKEYGNTQYALAMKGLLDYSPPNRKLGLVLFSPPMRESAFENILNDLRNRYSGRFDYFIISTEWSKALGKLRHFLGLGELAN